MSECVIEGNSDLYGIGVRVGLYTQWVAQLITTIFQPNDEKELRVVNLIVQVSLFLGICTESTNGGSPIGSVITQLLLCGSLSSLTNKGLSYGGGLSALFRCLFYMALSSYGIWFWFVGIDHMPVENCETKDQVVFFGHASITGRFRTFGKFVGIFGLIVCLCILFIALGGKKLMPSSKSKPEQSDEPQVRPKIEIVYLFVSMALLAFSVALVEYLVKVNKIEGLSDVDSVGQFLPLLVGAISLFQAISSTLGGKMEMNRCWFLFGHHLGLNKRNS